MAALYTGLDCCLVGQLIYLVSLLLDRVQFFCFRTSSYSFNTVGSHLPNHFILNLNKSNCVLQLSINSCTYDHLAV